MDARLCLAGLSCERLPERRAREDRLIPQIHRFGRKVLSIFWRVSIAAETG